MDYNNLQVLFTHHKRYRESMRQVKTICEDATVYSGIHIVYVRVRGL